MTTTYFRPSIHGWPFGNSFQYSFLFDKITLTMGFCGGMCWRALKRFYGGTCIPRDIQAPSQGDALYDEIFDAQKDSLPGSTLWKILSWQRSPDQGHWYRSDSSLGNDTQQEWSNIKSSLDNSQPVTLTLITSSNDGRLLHLSNNHRVVAYAYQERELYDWEWVHPDNKNDDPSYRAQIGAVDILIYDPNYPNDDDVYLTFYKGCDDSWIDLKHSKGLDVHGFFLDDKDRSYASADSTILRINKCEQTGISSATMADYDLKFFWRCRFIPYFCIQVDGIDWNYNSLLRDNYEPKNRPDGTPFVNKQCPTRTDSVTVSLKLTRARSKVAVKLLDTDDYYQSVEVDAVPAIDCYPYVRRGASGGSPQVHDTGITIADLFIKNPSPTQIEVQQLDTSPFRWIIFKPQQPVVDTRGRQNDLTKAVIVVMDSYQLGNIKVPVLADFVEKNLAAPTQTSGTVTIKNGQTFQIIKLVTLSQPPVKIFDGFTNNPANYDNDTTVEFIYTSKDRFGVVAHGQTTFYGRSIIYQQISATLYVFDPAKVARLEAIARDLIERNLIDIAIELPHVGDPGRGPFPPRVGGQLPPRPVDPILLMGKLRSHQKLQDAIDRTLKALWSNAAVWQEVWKEQSEMLKVAGPSKTVWTGKLAKAGEILKATNEIKEADQRKYDAVVLNRFANGVIDQLRRDPTVIDILKSL